LIARLLGDVAGWSIWDACAAPGGKSAILKELAGEDGLVVSTDLHLGRARRMRTVTAEVAVADASQSPPFRRAFDAVIADVPCSGLGTMRRNPEIKWRVQPPKLLELQAVQRRIVECAAAAVRPGGFLLYSTCSTEPEEDDHVVEGFLAANPLFALVRPQAPPGVAGWLDGRGFLRTFPGRRLWDGFFAALMRRSQNP
jgi:16S rRNA (cytosine967-C5)-methyltransferase